MQRASPKKDHRLHVTEVVRTTGEHGSEESGKATPLPAPEAPPFPSRRRGGAGPSVKKWMRSSAMTGTPPLLGEPDEAFESSGVEHIIGVDHRDPVAPRDIERTIARSPGAATGFRSAGAGSGHLLSRGSLSATRCRRSRRRRRRFSSRSESGLSEKPIERRRRYGSHRCGWP